MSRAPQLRNAMTPQLSPMQKQPFSPSLELDMAKREQTDVHSYLDVLNDRVDMAMNGQ